MLRPESFINLDKHCSEGRCLVKVGLDQLTPTEREWMFKCLEEAKEGREIQFGANTLEGGTIVFTFALAPPMLAIAA